MPDPSQKQIQSAVDLLVPFAIEEVNNSGCGALGPAARTAKTPEDADTEKCGIGASWKGYTSVALPPGLCEAVGATTTTPQPDAGAPEAATPPPTPKPDAGTADAGVPEAAPPPVQPEAGTPEAGAPEAGTPEVVTPEAGGHQPEATGPSPLQTAQNNLQKKITKANKLIPTLRANNLNGEADTLQNAINSADDYLDNSSRSAVETATTQLNSAIAHARSALGI
jgi:hypothetical protein